MHPNEVRIWYWIAAFEVGAIKLAPRSKPIKLATASVSRNAQEQAS